MPKTNIWYKIPQQIMDFAAELANIQKSVVSRYSTVRYYAVKDGNVLSLGDILPPESVDEQTPSVGKFILLVARESGYTRNISVETLPDGADQIDAQSKALDLVEENKNNIMSVLVCTGLPKTFANRPIYQSFVSYDFVAKSDETYEDPSSEMFALLEKAGTEPQSILFPVGKYTVEQARKWLTSHGKHAGKVDTTENYHRFRQFDPSSCSTTPKTISFGGSGIKAVICTRGTSASKSDGTTDDVKDVRDLDLDTDLEKSGAAINDLPDSDFAYIEPGGTKDAEGKTVPRSLRHFPIHDANHVRNALARLNQSPFGPKASAKVHAAAKKFGIKVTKEDEEIKESMPDPVNFERFVEIVKSNFQNGLVYGVVYAPNDKDTHGDWTSAEEIERAAHEFLPVALRNGTSGWTDVNHKDDVDAVELVESYIAPCDFAFPTGEKINKGTWVLVAKVNNEELKKAILDGEITGFSLEGKAQKLDIDIGNVA